ncbi:MAG: T9SS type A sorting domain-containing protein [candidate division Zixibacteria bacterium]|nr:T9SS type A sorting domain-containing protein [candidate division Zixibacteria bacterium]
MKRKVLYLLFSTALLFGLQPVLAQECVELDIEFPNEASSDYGGMVNGFVELINCGDEAGVAWLEIEVEVMNQYITLGLVPLNLGAGEGVSRELFIPTPPSIFGDSIMLCVTAYADAHDSSAALASECASIYIPNFGGGELTGTSPTFGMALSGAEGECVNVDLELPDTVQAAPGSFLEGAFELGNCGDEASFITLEATFEFFDTSITIGGVPVDLGAGETIAREFRFPVPPAMPEGEYTVCITATSGSAVATTCQTVFVEGFFPSNDGDDKGSNNESSVNLGNYPNPFNPTTTISFYLENAGSYTVKVYDVTGREVWSHSGSAGVGEVNVELDATGYSTGVYFYRLTTDDISSAKKMLLLK